MKRFNFDESDEEENDDDVDNPSFFSMAQFPMEPENDLMNYCIKICENNIFWKFYNIDSKLKDIEKTYNLLKSIINEESEGE